jgi:hypothetical protein
MPSEAAAETTLGSKLFCRQLLKNARVEVMRKKHRGHITYGALQKESKQVGLSQKVIDDAEEDSVPDPCKYLLDKIVDRMTPDDVAKHLYLHHHNRDGSVKAQDLLQYIVQFCIEHKQDYFCDPDGKLDKKDVIWLFAVQSYKRINLGSEQRDDLCLETELDLRQFKQMFESLLGHADELARAKGTSEAKVVQILKVKHDPGGGYQGNQDLAALQAYPGLADQYAAMTGQVIGQYGDHINMKGEEAKQKIEQVWSYAGRHLVEQFWHTSRYDQAQYYAMCLLVADPTMDKLREHFYLRPGATVTMLADHSVANWAEFPDNHQRLSFGQNDVFVVSQAATFGYWFTAENWPDLWAPMSAAKKAEDVLQSDGCTQS